MNALRAGGVVGVGDGHLTIDVPTPRAFQPRPSSFWRRLLETRLVGTGLAISVVVLVCAWALHCWRRTTPMNRTTWR